MGACLTQIEPDSEFGDRDESGRAKRRRECTDVFFLCFMGAFVAVVGAFMIYCSTIADVNRILHGYDNFGNVCGQRNPPIDGSDPTHFGRDMTAKPYLLEKIYVNSLIVNRTCVDNCEDNGYETIFGRCVPKDDGDGHTLKPIWQQISEDVAATKLEIFYMSMISLALVGLTVMLLRYNTESFIWAILIGGAVALVFICIGLWVAYGGATTPRSQGMFLQLGIYSTVFAVALVLCLLVMFKRIKMVVALFKEASKAIGAVPHLLLEPIITIFAFFVSSIIYGFGLLMLGSAGGLRKMDNDLYEYMPNNVVIFTAVIFVVGWVWMLHFFVGCQSMIVGGTISSWYFVRDKSRLMSPVWSATSNLLRFHLGSVAFGSLIMLIMQLVRMIIDGLKRAARENGCGICLLCCSCIFTILEDIVRYFSRLAYIMTSMHGVSFCVGGKSAMRLIVNNGLSTIALNSVGSFILFFINLMIMVTTAVISYYMMDKPGLNSVWWPLLVSVFIACFMAYCVLTVYDTTLDTIFLCFCEDSEQNDGLSRPYYMSAELMLFVENSKKALEQLEAEKENKKNKRRGGSAFNNHPEAFNTPAPA